jgi:ATP-dependent RNA helicase DeaD
VNSTFESFNLSPELLVAVERMEFKTPTPIQSASIPKILSGSDLIGCAQTGSGKTAAFSLPMLDKLLKTPGDVALILAPTRELAEQIHRVVRDLSEGLPNIGTSLLIGGTSFMPQRRTLSKRPRVIVATPGRLLDHLRQRTTDLKRVSYLVLDEADRMLDMGFAPQLEAILGFLPEKRQSLLFSATVPPNIRSLAKDYLNNPHQVSIESLAQEKPDIKETSLRVDAARKRDILLEQIKIRTGTMVIFARTQQRTERLSRFLEDSDLSVAQIHGGRTHGQRQTALRGFRDGEFRILVATDLAARGLDIDHVEHVINFDLPRDPEDYVHRIGRTGRAGRSGEALSLIEDGERNLWFLIERSKDPSFKGERPDYSNGGNGGARRGGGSFRKKRFGGGGKSFGGKRSFGDKPAFNRDKPRGGDKPASSDSASFRSEKPATGSKPFGDRPVFDKDKPSFKRGKSSFRGQPSYQKDRPARSDSYTNRPTHQTASPGDRKPAGSSDRGPRPQGRPQDRPQSRGQGRPQNRAPGRPQSQGRPFFKSSDRS